MTRLTPSAALDATALVLERWPATRMNGEQQRRYAIDLEGLDAEHTDAAIDVLHRRGRDFAPTAGQIRLEVARLEFGAPEWAEVKRQMIARNAALLEWSPPEWTCPLGACDGGGYVEVPRDIGRAVKRCACWPQRSATRRLAESLHPLVREFIGQNYVTWAEVDALGRSTGQREGLTLEAQVRDKWAAFSARAIESRAMADLDAGGLRRLEQARAEDEPRREKRRGQLGRMDPLAALPGPQHG